MLTFIGVKVKYLQLYLWHFVTSSIYSNFSAMLQSSEFQDSMLLATLMYSKYANIPVILWCIHMCTVACKITVFTVDTCW